MALAIQHLGLAGPTVVVYFEGAFAKLEKGKREPLIDALVDSGFDYSQFVPSVVSNVIKTKGRK